MENAKRGILKRSLTQPWTGEKEHFISNYHRENTTVSGPLTAPFSSQWVEDAGGEGNTTSRLTQKDGRRVSFAPDVTLHKFSAIKDPMHSNDSQSGGTSFNVEPNEESMELTAPLTNIQLQSAHENETMKFANTNGGLNSYLDENNDSTMELTGTHSVPQYEIVQNNETKSLSTPLDMRGKNEPDEGPPKGVSEDFKRNVKTKNHTHPAFVREGPDHSLEMELTETMSVKQPQMKHKYTANSEVTNTDNGNIPIKAFEHADEILDKSLDMEFTQVMPPALINHRSRQQMRTVDTDDSALTRIEFGGFMPTETSTQKSPSGLKRRKISDDVEFKENEYSTEMHSIEQLSPVKIAMTNFQEEGLSPVKLSSDKASPGALRSKYSLKVFFDDIGLDFIVETDLTGREDQYVMKIQPLEEDEWKVFRVDKVLKALYIDLPILEMNTFILNELKQRIVQTKHVLDDVSNQVKSSATAPLLLQEFYISSNADKMNMSKKLRLIQTFSNLEARKFWSKWRLEQLQGLKTVLEGNLATLRNELDNVRENLSKAYDIRMRITELKSSIKKEFMILKEIPNFQEPSLRSKLETESLRQELALQKENVTRLAKLASTKIGLEREIEENLVSIQILRKEIALESEKTPREASKSSSLGVENEFQNRLNDVHLKSRFDFLQKLSEVKFVSLKQATLVMQLVRSPKLILTLDLRSNKLMDVSTQGLEDKDLFFCHCMNCLRTAEDSNDLESIMRHVAVSLDAYKEYKIMRAIWPLKLRALDNECIIEAYHYDPYNQNMSLLRLPLINLLELTQNLNKKVLIEVEIVRQSRTSNDQLQQQLIAKAQRCLPWFRAKNLELRFI